MVTIVNTCDTFFSFLYTCNKETPIVYLMGNDYDKLLEQLAKKLKIDDLESYYDEDEDCFLIPKEFYPYRSEWLHAKFQLYVVCLKEGESAHDAIRNLELGC